jgi:hypothetical protein
MRLLAILALGLGACASEIDPEADGLTPIADYQSWTLALTTEGPLAGHGESVRVIYANPVARSYSHSGRYPVGSVLVKEIYGRNEDGSRGTLRYLSIMRKVGEDANLSAPVEGGWVWSLADTVTSPEKSNGSCWGSCHRQAPRDGAWVDYGQ